MKRLRVVLTGFSWLMIGSYSFYPCTAVSMALEDLGLSDNGVRAYSTSSTEIAPTPGRGYPKIWRRSSIFCDQNPEIEARILEQAEEEIQERALTAWSDWPKDMSVTDIVHAHRGLEEWMVRLTNLTPANPDFFPSLKSCTELLPAGSHIQRLLSTPSLYTQMLLMKGFSPKRLTTIMSAGEALFPVEVQITPPSLSRWARLKHRLKHPKWQKPLTHMSDPARTKELAAEAARFISPNKAAQALLSVIILLEEGNNVKRLDSVMNYSFQALEPYQPHYKKAPIYYHDTALILLLRTYLGPTMMAFKRSLKADPFKVGDFLNRLLLKTIEMRKTSGFLDTYMHEATGQSLIEILQMTRDGLKKKHRALKNKRHPLTRDTPLKAEYKSLRQRFDEACASFGKEFAPLFADDISSEEENEENLRIFSTDILRDSSDTTSIGTSTEHSKILFERAGSFRSPRTAPRPTSLFTSAPIIPLKMGNVISRGKEKEG